MMAAEKRGEAVAAAASGEPPALFTSTSSRPRRDEREGHDPIDGVRVAHVGGDEERLLLSAAREGRRARDDRRSTTSAPSSRKRQAMPRPMPLPPPVTITARPDMSSAPMGNP